MVGQAAPRTPCGGGAGLTTRVHSSAAALPVLLNRIVNPDAHVLVPDDLLGEESSVALPASAVKQLWHERFCADSESIGLRHVMAELLGRRHTPSALSEASGGEH